MPPKTELPEDLEDLAYRNGFELRHQRWESDVQEMLARLGLGAGENQAAESGPAVALESKKRSWLPIAGATVMAMVVVVGGLLYYPGPDEGEDLDEIWRLVDDGTPIHILP